MIDKILHTGMVVVHIRTETKYTVQGHGQAKIADSQWVESVRYCPYGYPDREFYRSKKDFFEKFRLE